MEFTPQQIKRLERLARIEKNPTLEIVDELAKVKNVLKKVSDKEVIFPEQREEITISNPEDIKNDIIEAISQVKGIVEKYIASKMAVDAQKESKMVKHTSEKEKSLGELKIAIIEAIQNLAENIPEQKDYSGQIKQILDSLTGKKELNLKSLEEGLDKILKAVDTPDFLNDIVEYNRVKVSLSDEQIKKLGKSMSVSVASGSGFPGSSQADLKRIADNQGNINSAGNKVISTYLDKFRDDFFDLSNWDVVQVGSGMSYKLRGVANGARFLAINSGTTSGEETILKAKAVFTVPFKIAFGASVTLSSDTSGAATSGRQVNLWPIFEVVECDEDGNVVETGSSQTYSGTVPNVMAYCYNGTIATTQRLILRSSGNSEWNAATAMGTYSTTLPTGSWPNYIQAGNQIMVTNNEFANFLSERADTTTAGTNIKRNTSLIDPTKKYTIRIRLKNNGTVIPADFNIHMVRVMDASRISVDFGMINGSYADAQQSIPVYSTGGSYVIAGENPSTSYGAAYYYSSISDASINATNIKATTCLLISLNAMNRADYTCYLKIYSKATVPDPSIDIPVAVFPLPCGDLSSFNLGRYAHRHTAGLSYLITKNPEITDNTPIAAGDVILNISYA